MKKNTTDIERLGKDIVNLVEYPFAVLGKNTGAQALEHKWEARHPVTGRPVQATWRVTGDSQLGLPNATDERVYLVLMELTREAGFAQDVYFTRYNLLKRLDWPDNQQSYKMLRESLRRLRSVTISSENAFWDPAAKAYVDVGFGIIDNYEIVSERPGRKKKDGNSPPPLSHFRWNDVIFSNIQSGYIRSLDLGFALSLKGPIALRLYRYLDRKAHDGKETFEIELHRLCELHLGMTPTSYVSTLKVRLDPAHKELIERGFLDKVDYSTMRTRPGEKVRYSFPRGQLKTGKPEASEPKLSEGKTSEGREEAAATIEVVQEFDELAERLVAVGVSRSVAEELRKQEPAEMIQLQLDCLADRKPNDPPAALVSAIRNKWPAPPAYQQRIYREQQEQQSRDLFEHSRRKQAEQEQREREESARIAAENSALDAMFEKLDARTRERIDNDARQRLGVLGATGRAQGALLAMRRALLRELLGQAVTEVE